MVRFVLFRVPVYIYPVFWVAGAVWGVALTRCQPGPVAVVYFVLALFVCLLMHELGHAAVGQRMLRERVQVHLTWLGGMSCCAGEPTKPYTRRAEVLTTLAGPVAGLLPALAIYAGLLWALPQAGNAHELLLHMLQGQVPMEYAESCPPLIMLTGVYILQISVWWSGINLLPIYPLDVGALMHRAMGANGRAHLISMMATCIMSMLFIAIDVWALAALMLILTYFNYRCFIRHQE